MLEGAGEGIGELICVCAADRELPFGFREGTPHSIAAWLPYRTDSSSRAWLSKHWLIGASFLPHHSVYGGAVCWSILPAPQPISTIECCTASL